MNVLILGARAPAALEWARLAHTAGHTVYTADSLYFPLARFSRYSAAYFKLPSPRFELREWRRCLISAAERWHIDLIIPTCEEIFFLSSSLTDIPPSCRVLCADISDLDKLHNKAAFAAMTKGWPIAAPESHLVSKLGDVRKICGDLSEWIVKPCYSRFGTSTVLNLTERTLRRVLSNSAQKWVLQRKISGHELCSYSLLSNGRVLAHVCYSPKYRINDGAGIFFAPVRSDNIATFVELFGRETGFTGQVGFDYITDAAGKTYVLECNPRATSGFHLFSGRGQDIFDGLLNGARLSDAEPSAAAVSLAMFLFGWQGSTHSVADFLRDLWLTNDVIGRKDDRLPAIGQVVCYGELCARGLVHRLSPLAASTYDIEWNGAPHA